MVSVSSAMPIHTNAPRLAPRFAAHRLSEPELKRLPDYLVEDRLDLLQNAVKDSNDNDYPEPNDPRLLKAIREGATENWRVFLSALSPKSRQAIAAHRHEEAGVPNSTLLHYTAYGVNPNVRVEYPATNCKPDLAYALLESVPEPAKLLVIRNRDGSPSFSQTPFDVANAGGGRGGNSVAKVLEAPVWKSGKAFAQLSAREQKQAQIALLKSMPDSVSREKLQKVMDLPDWDVVEDVESLRQRPTFPADASESEPKSAASRAESWEIPPEKEALLKQQSFPKEDDSSLTSEDASVKNEAAEESSKTTHTSWLGSLRKKLFWR